MAIKGFGERLREVRKSKKLSQTKLAKLIGVHYVNYGRYEHGKSSPSAETLIKLAEVLEVPVDFLVHGSSRKIAENEIADRELLMLFHEIQSLGPYDKIDAKKLIGDFVQERKRAGRAAS